MVNYTLGDLIHDSFRVTHGMIAVFPQNGHEVTLSVDFFVLKFDGCFTVANNLTVIGFISNGKYFVTPYTARAIATLAENDFKEASFYVPFSALDYPKREENVGDSFRKRPKKLLRKTSRLNVKNSVTSTTLELCLLL